MRRLVLFMHVSVDGFVGGPNGEMDWIHVDEDMFEYAGQQTDNADTALYGRRTFEMMQSYWPTAADLPNATKHDIQHSQWYSSVEKLVVSRTMQNEFKNVTMLRENIADEVAKRKQESGKNIVIFGSPSAAHLLMQHNLIDDYWLFINPVILGGGIPLFKDVQERLKLKLVWNKIFDSKVVGLHYKKE